MNMDLLTLKLHVDDTGEVWYLNGDGPPVRTKLPVIGFMMHPLCRTMPKVRVAGMPQNIHMILGLFSARLQAEAGSVEICSPLVCRTKAERHDPPRVLYAMRQYERAASVGGWHTMNKDDYASYSLVSHLQKSIRVDDHARRLLKAHPAWPPLSFIPHLNNDACCQLLALIGDPRWFINHVHMSRGSKLRSFLGLDLATMTGVMGLGPKQRYHDRCRLVLDAWAGGEAQNLKLVERPDYFLWRIFREASEKKGSVIGTLRASQAFVEYLRLIWLAAIGRGRHQLEALFVPDYFFKEDYEAKAFYKHFSKFFGD